MMGNTHLAIGVLLLFILAKFTDLVHGNELAAVFLLLVSSILPDIDHAESIIGRKFRFFNWMFRHRGFFHSIFAMILFTVIIQMMFLNQKFSLLFLAGYASHLLSDSITREGTSLFYPQKKKIKGPLKVGSIFETMIFMLLLVLTAYLVL